MDDMLRTIEFLGHHISKYKIVSMELLPFCNEMTRKKVILLTGVTARKRSESESFLQICQIWLNYVWHIKNNRISLSRYIKKQNCFHLTAIPSQQDDQEENDLGHGGNC